MAQPPHLTSHYSFHSALKASYQALNVKAQLEAYFLRQACRLVQALSNAKSFIVELLNLTPSSAKENSSNYIKKMSRRRRRRRLVKSITTWCNWHSNHVIPMPELTKSGVGPTKMSQRYYDSTWDSVVSEDDDVDGYLQWLEEKESGTNWMVDDDDDDDDASKIDRLAEKFIESCHEKFRLEKQESYRRYLEMLARSM